jgi:xanthine dehydrogenase YagR molybdenum-binding subunit
MHNPTSLEPSATTAVWDGGTLIVYESTQGITLTQLNLSQAFGIAPTDIRVVAPFLGGGFGGKGPVWPHTILTAAVAREVGRPVKLVLSRAHVYTSSGHRAETHQTLVLSASGPSPVWRGRLCLHLRVGC